MKQSVKIILIVVGVIAFLALIIGGTYNGLYSRQQKVEKAQSDISTQLQRRADLIPNFVSSVKGYTKYEGETYKAVTEARASVGNAKTTEQQADAHNELNRAIDIWVNAVTENYPELKADKQFTALQDELAGTENRIATARKDYNTAVEKYNSSVGKFPKNIIASMFGFEKADYFESSADASSVPQVSFD